MKSKVICLNMIVKDESEIIQRCLESVKPIIDHWVIVDTGSNDGTQKIILEVLGDIPGELHERPWVNFEHNRNESLQMARKKADYILFMDADDTLEFSSPLDKGRLDQDCYHILCRDPVVDSYRPLLINNHPEWKWVGEVHETIFNPCLMSSQILPGVMKNGMARDGKRAKDSKRYLKDAAILEESLRKDPDNPRTVFYLAQSYVTAKEERLALKYYEQRARMGGFPDEAFWSLYYAAALKEDLGMPSQEVIDSYQKAYEFDRTRAEPLCSLSRYLMKIGNYPLSYLSARAATTLGVPMTPFFVRRDVYAYESLLYFAYSAHLIERFDEAIPAYQELLKKDLPLDVRKNVQAFLSRGKRRLPIQVATSPPT